MTRALLLVSLLGLCASPPTAAQESPGAVAAPRKLTKQQRRQFNALMSKAKAAAKKGKHAAAMTLYDKALAIRPGDLAALTDQGWSAFLLPDLPRAERITRQAVAAEGRDRISAAAHYNLGRILEARNDKAGAVAAYENSLSMRPNRVVREQLGKLDPAAAAEADPLKPEPMRGPFATLADFCKTLEDKKNCPADGQITALAKPAPPYLGGAWFQAEGGALGTCFLALQLDKGWFVQSRGVECYEGAGYLETQMLSFETTDLVPGGNREVVLRTAAQVAEDEGHSDRIRVYNKECIGWLTACGVGLAEVPSCLHLQFARAEPHCGDTPEWEWQLEPMFSKGQVDVKATGDLDADARALMGRRPLAFP